MAKKKVVTKDEEEGKVKTKKKAKVIAEPQFLEGEIPPNAIATRNSFASLAKDKNVVLTPVGLLMKKDMPFEEYEQIGNDLTVADDAMEWAWVDYLNYGQFTYREKYHQAAAISGKDPATLRNMNSVGNKIPHELRELALDPETRKPLLTFSHFRKLTSLEKPQIKKFIKDAIAGDKEGKDKGKTWTVERLAKEVREFSKGPGYERERGDRIYDPLHVTIRGKEADEGALAYSQFLDKEWAHAKKYHIDPDYADEVDEKARQDAITTVVKKLPADEQAKYAKMADKEGTDLDEIKELVKARLTEIAAETKKANALKKVRDSVIKAAEKLPEGERAAYVKMLDSPKKNISDPATIKAKIKERVTKISEEQKRTEAASKLEETAKESQKKAQDILKKAKRVREGKEPIGKKKEASIPKPPAKKGKKADEEPPM